MYPAFHGFSGHEVSFVDCLEEFAKKIKSKIFFIIPVESNVKLKGKKIVRILYTISRGYISTLKNIIRNIFILKNLLKKNNLKFKKKNLYFVDGYSFDFLFSFLIAKIFFKKEGLLLIYVRYDYEKLKFFLFKLFLLCAKNFFLKIKLLTDSTSLSKKIHKKFQMKVETLPIPHTFKRYKKKKKIKKKNYTFLCPGQIRDEKYGENFNRFLKLNNKSLYSILINEKFKINKIKTKIKFSFIKENLTVKKYQTLFKKADIVLLPYDSKLYQFRTSGIFIEAIAQRKILLVSNNTWMSDELKKNNLNQLIVDNWSNFIFQNFLKKYFLQSINKNIDLMSEYYLKIHSKKNYINQLFKIIK